MKVCIPHLYVTLLLVALMPGCGTSDETKEVQLVTKAAISLLEQKDYRKFLSEYEYAFYLVWEKGGFKESMLNETVQAFQADRMQAMPVLIQQLNIVASMDPTRSYSESSTRVIEFKFDFAHPRLGRTETAIRFKRRDGWKNFRIDYPF